MTPEEEARLTKTAHERPEWRNARLGFELARNTAMRCAEIRNLRWSDIDLMAWTLTVCRAGTKTNSGVRTIPLNADAQRAVLELRKIAKGFAGGQASPDWYLFARRQGLTHADPSRPLAGWRTAWRALRAAAGKGDEEKGISPMPTLVTLRFHDLRHHVISRLAEGQTSDQTIMSIAGHGSPRMLAHYSHIRMEAKRTALESLGTKPDGITAATQPRDTSQITSQNGFRENY
jgi:integrase